MKTQYEFVKELYEEFLKDDYRVQKYKHPGIYSISINKRLVYIGKSRDMLMRVSSHIINTGWLNKENNKYKVLYEAYLRADVTIDFDVLYVSPYTNQGEIDIDIGYQEAYYINKYMPPLNYQIPYINDFKHSKANKIAETITLDEILTDTK